MSFFQAQIGVRRGTLNIDLALEAEPGEVLALLGPNGSGKSSSIGVIAGLVKPDSGFVRLGKRVLHDVAERTWLAPEDRHLGVVFQNGRLFSHLSAVDNVAFGPRARGLGKSTARTRAISSLASVGASEFADLKPGQLSGGQAQRVALARALATEPDVLLLDEPMSALDAQSRISIRSDLRRFLREFTGVSIVVTHDLYDATAIADRLVVMESGHAVQRGSAYEVATRPQTDYVAELAGVVVLAGQGTGSSVQCGTLALPLAAPVGAVRVGVPPQAVQLATTPSVDSVSMDVVDIEPRGARSRVGLVRQGGPRIVSEIDTLEVVRRDIEVGSAVPVLLQVEEMVVY